MRRLRLWLHLTLAIVPWTRESSGADTPASFPNGPAAFTPRVVAPIDDAAVAQAIDRSLAARWEKEGVTPAPHAGDAEFLRRVSLDVGGRIPPVSEARAFLGSTDPQKRRKLVERLLAGPAHANHMTNVWLELLVPEAKATVQAAFFAGDFQVWLHKQFTEGVGYDKIVRELLTVPAASPEIALNAARDQDVKPSPFAFIAAKEGKPENLAASTSRTFLGIRLECAQCHNHPFAKWKRDEFWGMAAFFAGIVRRSEGSFIFQGTDTRDKYEIEVPGSKRVVQASFLDGRKVERSKGTSARAKLADWVTSRDNPYFARAAANRVWFQFFGAGLIDPVDDMSAVADAIHPELLDLMADQFAAHNFDLKYLIRAITSSRAYQLSSAGGSPSSDIYRVFGRMPVRGLSPEQLFDSLTMATGLPREAVPPRGTFNVNNSLQGEFIERFASQEERPTERQTSILQALTLMNGRIVDDATSLGQGETLSAVANSDFLDTTGRIETLYLAALTRLPRPGELERLIPYVERGGPTADTKKALADVLWSLLVSAEFVFNH